MIGGIGAGRVSRSAVLRYCNDPVTSHITFLDMSSEQGPRTQYSPGKGKEKLPRTPWKTAGILKEQVNHGFSWRHGHPDSGVEKRDNGPWNLPACLSTRDQLDWVTGLGDPFIQPISGRDTRVGSETLTIKGCYNTSAYIVHISSGTG